MFYLFFFVHCTQRVWKGGCQHFLVVRFSNYPQLVFNIHFYHRITIPTQQSRHPATLLAMADIQYFFRCLMSHVKQDYVLKHHSQTFLIVSMIIPSSMCIGAYSSILFRPAKICDLNLIKNQHSECDPILNHLRVLIVFPHHLLHWLRSSVTLDFLDIYPFYDEVGIFF